MPHPAALPSDELLTQCTVRRTRRSGPGGQHRNKVETAVVIEHQPTGVRGEASERRSQADNRTVALFRLRLNLAINFRHSPHDSPSALWRSRCRDEKISVNVTHGDFPVMLAEALDALAHHGHHPPTAAAAMACSTSQLIKLIKQEPLAFAAVNRQRREAGLPPLK